MEFSEAHVHEQQPRAFSIMNVAESLWMRLAKGGRAPSCDGHRYIMRRIKLYKYRNVHFQLKAFRVKIKEQFYVYTSLINVSGFNMKS